MSLASTVAAGRAAAESLYLDTFTVYVPGARVTDSHGIEVPGYATRGTVSGKVAGPSRAPSTQRAAHMVTVAGVARPIVYGGLHISVNAEVPAMGEHGIGWEYVLSTLGPASDPALMGSRWLVVGAEAKSLITARRLDVVQL